MLLILVLIAGPDLPSYSTAAAQSRVGTASDSGQWPADTIARARLHFGQCPQLLSHPPITLPVRLDTWQQLHGMKLHADAAVSFAIYNRNKVLLGFIDVAMAQLLSVNTLLHSFFLRFLFYSSFVTHPSMCNNINPAVCTAAMPGECCGPCVWSVAHVPLFLWISRS